MGEEENTKAGEIGGQEFKVEEEWGGGGDGAGREKVTEEQCRTQELDLRNGTPYPPPRHLRMLAP